MEVASAVRFPTPEPELPSSSKRKRSPHSPSPSPPPHPSRRRSQSSPHYHYDKPRRKKHEPTGPLPRDVDHERARERQRQLEVRHRQEEKVDSKPLTAEEKQAAAKKEYEDLLNKRSGGVYIPPARLRALQSQITDQKSKEFQRMAWEALKKSINGLINKVNIGNIKFIVPELFGENLIRGRGLFCRSIMKAQASSLPFTPIFAATVAIVNTKLPQVGELLAHRLVASFRKGFKRNDKSVCISTTTFLAHLVNQQVIDYMLAAQMLLLLIHKPTDDSVEIAVNLVKECGQILEEMNGKIALAVFDQFRNILHEASDLEKRTQYMIEVLFQIRKDKWKDYPAIRPELDLVEEEDQITHQVNLDGEINTQDGLNIFKFDPEYEENEVAYKKLKAEILGEDEDGTGDEYESDEDSEDGEEAVKEREMEIKDQTNTDLSNLRRSIYLTIKSSGTFEEACHKLMRINLPSGYEKELPSMIIQCSYQEQTFNKFYGNIGERFCKLNRFWQEMFQDQFVEYYETIHRYETNKLRIIAQFFGHLFSNDAIGWHCLSIIHLNEDETTSSSRIFIKLLFEEIAASMGMNAFATKLEDDVLQQSLTGLFPKDNPTHTRFAINYFTAIGMGRITEGMREYLKNIPQPAPTTVATRGRSASRATSRSRSDSASTYSTSYMSGTDSRSVSRSRSRSRTPSRSRSTRRRGDYIPSESESPSQSRRRTRSPIHRGGRSRSGSVVDRGGRGRRRTRDSRLRSMSDSRSRSLSRSVSVHRSYRNERRIRARSETDSRSRSRSVSRRRRDSPPPKRRRNSSSVASHSLSPSRSRSRSPIVRRDRSRSPIRRSNSDRRGETVRGRESEGQTRSGYGRGANYGRGGRRGGEQNGRRSMSRERDRGRGRGNTSSVDSQRRSSSPVRRRRDSSESRSRSVSRSRSPPRRR